MKWLFLVFIPALFAATPTVQDAKKFLDEAEAKLLILSNESSRADWVHSNFITDDTEAIASQADGARNKKVQAVCDPATIPELGVKLPQATSVLGTASL